MAKFGGYGGGGGGFGGGNMQQIMRQAQKMQQEMAKAQEELEEAEFEATSGGGMVKVVVNGKKVLKAITLNPAAVDPEDVEMLEDLIIAAVNEAYEKADAEYEKKMGAYGGMF